MNIKIEGNRIKTTSEYDAKMIRALNQLEGMKRWGGNRSFTFENTPYNLEVWKQVFPSCVIELANAPTAVAEDGIFDVPSDRPTFKFKTQPREHQKKALEKISTLESCGMFMDVGTGKSWTAISIVGRRWCEGKSDHVLLVAKNGVHAQWVEEQIPAHMSESVAWKAWVWRKGKKADKDYEDMMKFEGLKIFTINIDAIITPAGESRIMEFLKSARGKATIIVDESQDIKNMAASRTKAAIRYGNICKYRMIMTGTPIAKDVVDLFSQFKFLDERILGHRYLSTFKSRYCIFRQTDFGPQLIGHQNIEELYKKIDPFIFRITSEEALDLPPKVYIQRPFALSAEQLKLIKELRQQFFTDVGKDDFSTVKNAASLLTRIQQISCGFLPKDDGTIMMLPNPRLEELVTILDQRSGKAIIWCRFNRDIETVKKKLGPSAVDYYGGTSPSDRDKNKKAFLNPESSVLYLVASPEAAGTGLNLQGLCKTNIYYSNSFNSLARWQSEGRTWRDGTTDTVTYFDLVARKSPDAKILANLTNKKSISDLTLDEYRKLFDAEEDL